MTSPQYPRLAAVPDHLATRFELRSWGLRPGGPSVATVTVIAKVSGATRQEKLYRVTEAVAVEPANTIVQGITVGKESAKKRAARGGPSLGRKRPSIGANRCCTAKTGVLPKLRQVLIRFGFKQQGALWLMGNTAASAKAFLLVIAATPTTLRPKQDCGLFCYRRLL